MPTYEYLCQNCGHRFETFQGIKAEPLKECPHCHQPALKRIISGGQGLIFKGSGFYITDYARKSVSNSTAHSEQKPAADKKPSTVKADKKPEPVKS